MQKIIKSYAYYESKILGSGTTGHVYKGYSIKTGNQIAIKVIDLKAIDNQVSQYLLLMQKNALIMSNHLNILKCIDTHQQNGNCYIVTQYCNGGTLKDLIQKEGKLSQERSLQILQNILKGYNECVKNKIVHRDLKPANIMIHNGQCKIIDFGYCMIQGFKKPKLQYNVGSPSYMAPQSYQWNMYNQKTQIWSIGVTFYQCLTGKTLDQGRKMSQTFKQFLQVGIYYPQYLSQRVKKLISWCLQYDPKHRPTCNILLSFIVQLREQLFHSNPQNSENQTNCKKDLYNNSFMYSTFTASKRNLSTQNYQNSKASRNTQKSLNDSNIIHTLTFKQSTFKNLNDQQKIKPKFETKILPQTTKQYRRESCKSNSNPQQKYSFLNHRLSNNQNHDPYQRNSQNNQKISKMHHIPGFASLRNKYNLRTDQTIQSAKKSYEHKQIGQSSQRYNNNSYYNNYITPTNYTVMRSPSITQR